MYFATAGIEVTPWIPPVVAFVISFFCSMGGISGAFLLLPFQVSLLGYTNPSVSATNQVFNIIAVPSGVYRYHKEKRMVWPLAWIVVLGTLPGVFIGAIIRVNYLPNPAHFKLFAAAVILYIGIKMVLDLSATKSSASSSKIKSEQGFHKAITQQKEASARTESTQEMPATTITHCTIKRLGYTFHGETFDITIWGVCSLTFIVGIIGGIYGIGGGAIIVPFFVTFFGLPIYTVAGAALMGTFVTSVAGVVFYQILAPFHPGMSVAPDWLLGSLFGLGGMAGMYLGARCQKFVPARKIKIMLVTVILFTAGKYIFEFFK